LSTFACRMDNLTPGRKLILDLLAQSVAKIQAAEAENEVMKVKDVKTENRKGGIKRELMEVPEKLRKKLKAGKKPEEHDGTKEEVQFILKHGDIKAENDDYKDKKENKVENNEEVKLGSKDKMLKNLELKIKSKKRKRGDKEKENMETSKLPFKINAEYTEMKTEEIDLGSYAKTEFKANIVKNESKKEIIKVDDESNFNSDTYVIKKEPTKQKLKEGHAKEFSQDKKLNSKEVKIMSNKEKRKKKDKVIVGTSPTPVMIKSKYTEIKSEDLDLDKSYVNHDSKVNKPPNCSIEEDDRLHVGCKNMSGPFEQAIKAKNVKQKDPEILNLKHKSKKRPSGYKCKRFSSEEDQIILKAIEEFGDNIDIAQIAEDLQRTFDSVRHEVLKLKLGNTKKKLAWKKYTLAEDLVILDAVLVNLGEDSLKVVNLTQSGWREIGAQIGKRGSSLRTRWDTKLRPWILQHFAGTRNLDLKRPLANFLVENFPDVNSIDWSSVVSNPEFAGHTQVSLRDCFSRFLFRNVLHKDGEDITLTMIAEFANAKYADGGRKVLDKDLKRQQDIIDYFECYVKTKGIKNFL